MDDDDKADILKRKEAQKAAADALKEAREKGALCSKFLHIVMTSDHLFYLSYEG